MKTVLFAWELGAGIGHVTSMSSFAARLRRHDIRLCAAVANLDSAQVLRDAGVETLQAPLWPVASFTAAERATQSSVSMSDLLAYCGLADEQAVRAMLRAWDDILKAVRPDLIVADYAPIASLTARGRIPLIVVGNGYTLPPSEMKRFPLLHRFYSPQWKEEEVLATVNRAIRSIGLSPLERLPQIFSADARLVETFPLLDPYDLQRPEPADGPAFGSPPIGRRQDANAILLYVSRGYKVRSDIFEALKPFASRLYIHAPELTPEQSGDFSRHGAQIHLAPLPLRETLPSSRLAIHLGGTGLAAEAIAAGVPQLVLATHSEQELNGYAVENAGIGRLFRVFDPQARLAPDAIHALVTDKELAERATLVGEQHRNMLQSLNPLEKFETAALRLLNA